MFPLMMFALGCLSAFLLAALVIPPFVRRQCREQDRVRRRGPKNLRESRAETDRMRAEYAISLRKQEQTVEAVKARAQKQLIELAERNTDIRELKHELSELTELADKHERETQKLRRELEKYARRTGDEAVEQADETETAPEPAKQPAPPDWAVNDAAPPEPAADEAPRLPGTPVAATPSVKLDDTKTAPADKPEDAKAAPADERAKGLAGRIQRLKNNG